MAVSVAALRTQWQSTMEYIRDMCVQHSHCITEWTCMESASEWCLCDAAAVWSGSKHVENILNWVKNKQVSCCHGGPTELYILKLYFLLRVIMRGRPNLVPDHAWYWMLEVRASGSWWTTIDWRERGDTVAVAQHWFSASAVVESRRNERARPEGAARLSSQISGSFFFFFVALTFPESKRYIYLDISSAAMLDRLFQQLQQHFSCTYPTIHLTD